MRAAEKSGVCLPLFNEHNQHLHWLMSRSVFGGPSVAYHRSFTSESFIRNDENHPCVNITGLDANSLYLFCLDKELPCNIYIERRAEDNFYPIFTHQHRLMYMFLRWYGDRNEVVVKHLKNSGREVITLI